MMKGSILIASGDECTRDALKNLLSTAGYDARVAMDAVGVNDQIRTRQPDLIMLDFCIPGGFAPTIIAGLRRQPRSSTLPVIVMAEPENRLRAVAAYDAGANAFLPKPFNKQVLFVLLGRLMQPGSSREIGVVQAGSGDSMHGKEEPALWLQSDPAPVNTDHALIR
jgi:DNA-binding response OmpR family regulator